jgi:acetyl-CoA carboxylase biotin carboxylase subunit
MEKFLENPRHVEIQVLADSTQRRLPGRARLLDAAPPPEGHRGSAGARHPRAALIERIGDAAPKPAEDRLPRRRHLRVPVRERRVLLHRDEHPRAGRAPGHRADHRHRHRAEQIRIAAGEKLRFTQRDIELRGHAIECRINAEDPFKFVPSPGRITMWHPPGGPGVRVDSHVYTGYFVPPNYDSMIGKVIAYGDTRDQAIRAHAHRAVEMWSRASRPTSRCTAS